MATVTVKCKDCKKFTKHCYDCVSALEIYSRRLKSALKHVVMRSACGDAGGPCYDYGCLLAFRNAKKLLAEK